MKALSRNKEKTSLPGVVELRKTASEFHDYFYCACLAQWIGCVTPNVASAGSTPPKVETKNFNWVAPSWLVY